MRALLDTHVFLWWLRDDRKLGARTREAISEPDNTVVVSSVSILEIAIKVSIGKLNWRDSRSVKLETCIEDAGFEPLAITPQHAAAVRDLPRLHADPFDRLLLAQRNLEGLSLITADKALGNYPGIVVDATS